MLFKNNNCYLFSQPRLRSPSQNSDLDVVKTYQNYSNRYDLSIIIIYSKIPWYPKLLFQRENALASFWILVRFNMGGHGMTMGNKLMKPCRRRNVCICTKRCAFLLCMEFCPPLIRAKFVMDSLSGTLLAWLQTLFIPKI
jgi:hypothetical protein